MTDQLDLVDERLVRPDLASVVAHRGSRVVRFERCDLRRPGLWAAAVGITVADDDE